MVVLGRHRHFLRVVAVRGHSLAFDIAHNFDTYGRLRVEAYEIRI